MGIAGLSQVPTKEIKITQDPCETEDQRRGKTFPNLSSGSTIRSGISDTACVLSWPNSHWAVRVLDYPDVSSIPLHSWPVLHSWKTVSTCAEWMGPQVLPAVLLNSRFLQFPSIRPFLSSPPPPAVQGTITAPSISIDTGWFSSFHVPLLPSSPRGTVVSSLNASPWSNRNTGRNHAFSRKDVWGKAPETYLMA